MIIKYCPKCNMRPYTTDMSATNCPSCNSNLMIEAVNSENDLIGRPQLNISPNFNQESDAGSNYDSYGEENQTPPIYTPINLKSSDTSEKSKKNEIIGRVYGYSNSAEEAGKYKRIFITKIIDALIYGQRTEDVLHRFYLRPEGDTSIQNDVPVVIHGTLSAGSGITDNSLVKVRGKYHNGAFYARKITVMNNGRESSVRPQVSLSKLFITILSLLFLFTGIGLFIFDRNGVNTGLLYAKNFLIIFAVVYLILYLLSLIMMARSKFAFAAIALSCGGIKGIGIINFILSIAISIPIFKLLLSVGFNIAGIFSTFGPIIIIVIGIILMISCIVR